MRSLRFAAIVVTACAGSPNNVQVELAPSLISSLDGTTTVHAIVASDTTPMDNVSVHVDITYTDRNGTAHMIPSVDGKTDPRGWYETQLTGLSWDGTGTVTVSHGAITASADFAVLDRTPPKITILPPTTDLRVGPGLPLDVQVHATDEIGVSQITLDGTGLITGGRTTVIASGSLDATVTFRMFVDPAAVAGPTITLNALASDLSGNLATAAAVTLTVDPTITIATPPGLMGSLLTDGNATTLTDPRAIAASPMDGKLYVADRGGGACNGRCIWQVDPATGVVNTTPVYIGQGTIAGVAFDATGANLYFTDNQNITGRLTYNGTIYTGVQICNDVTQQIPQNPFHVFFDATLGILTPDDNNKDLVQVNPCGLTTTGVNFTARDGFGAPRGVGEDTNGTIYVSDIERGTVSKVDRNTKAVTAFAGGFNQPFGVEWLGTSTTQFANSLMVAAQGDRIVTAANGTTQLAAAYLRNSPIDLAFIGGTMYILTTPSANNRGRIYKVTGF